MMLKFLAMLILIVGGITASNICDVPPLCQHPPATKDFPETNEDLQKFCEPVIKFMECTYHYDEICRNMDPESHPEEYRLYNTLREICSEDTLLHAAVVDNLKCYADLINQERLNIRMCRFGRPETDRVQKFGAALIEEGIVSLPDNENVTHILRRCSGMLDFLACHSLIIENTCGNAAMETYIEVMKKSRLGFTEGCEYSFDFLPTIIRLRRAEEEEAERSIAEAPRKRK